MVKIKFLPHAEAQLDSGVNKLTETKVKVDSFPSTTISLEKSILE